MPNAASLAPTASAAPAFTLSVFVALSAGLTGVAAARLRPAGDDPADIVGRFHAAIVARVPAAALDQVAAIFLAAPTPTEGASAVLDDPAVGPVGRCILKLWLLGAWHAPEAPGEMVEIIPAQTYKKSPAWRALQAHPTGRGHLAFGRPRRSPAPPAPLPDAAIGSADVSTSSSAATRP